MNTMGHSLVTLAKGMEIVFDSIQEAPRFGTFDRNVKRGADPKAVIAQVRKLTGDNTRSGRVYSPGGARITADAVNKEMLAPSKQIGWMTEFIREGTPYFNPMVQGLRRAGESFIKDPIGTNLRAWTAIGLPALSIVGWNEMLGPEYNEFSFKERSSRDIAMNLYIGIPGLPPERGIQVPIAHELTLFKSPFETGLYALMRGEEGEDVRKMMMHMAGTSLTQTAMVGIPIPVSAMFAVAGQKAPSSILNPLGWQDDVYQLREDNVGLLPANLEATVRTLFGGTANTVLTLAAALSDGGPAAFMEEMYANMLKNTPMVKNVTGFTTPVTSFTPLSAEKERKVDALGKFLQMYNEHANPDTEGLLASRPLGKTKGRIEERDTMSRAHIAPLASPKPSNPLIYEFGELLVGALKNNDEGYDGVTDRYNIISKQLRLLRGYSAGQKDKFREWRKTYEGADEGFQKEAGKLAAVRDDALATAMNEKERKSINTKYEDATGALQKNQGEFARIDRLVKSMKLDLGDRHDVLKLISVLERERMQLLSVQLKIIEETENRITEDLRVRGLLAPGQKFSVEKDLGPLLREGLLVPQPLQPLEAVRQ
jgi:hypothetical protein